MPQDVLFVFSYDKPKTVAVTDGAHFYALPEWAGIFYYAEYLFSIDDKPYFGLVETTSALLETQYKKPEEMFPEIEFKKLSSYRKDPDRVLVYALETAWNLFAWYRDNRLCGRCGEILVHDSKIRSLSCKRCGNTVYPRIMPAVIVGAIHDDSILMTRYAGREYKGHALIAGFCEIGESCEDTVRREVMEECGLKVNNIRYFGSQPWGFDSNLLMGYFCDVIGELKITLDETELSSARFIPRAEIDDEPDHLSLTREMILAFKEGNEG